MCLRCCCPPSIHRYSVIALRFKPASSRPVQSRHGSCKISLTDMRISGRRSDIGMPARFLNNLQIPCMHHEGVANVCRRSCQRRAVILASRGRLSPNNPSIGYVEKPRGITLEARQVMRRRWVGLVKGCRDSIGVAVDNRCRIGTRKANVEHTCVRIHRERFWGASNRHRRHDGIRITADHRH